MQNTGGMRKAQGTTAPQGQDALCAPQLFINTKFYEKGVNKNNGCS